MGVGVLKHPCDLWNIQHIVFKNNPDVIVETGTAHGGSAVFLADLCLLKGSGRVITVDIDFSPLSCKMDHITYLRYDSKSPELREKLKELIKPDESVMVILDSDHHADHVEQEINNLSPFVTMGQYLLVEDTNLNLMNSLPGHTKGPAESIRRYMLNHNDFVADTQIDDLYGITYHPGGWLKRVLPRISPWN